MSRLAGKTAIITGAARGMGLEFAKAFVAEGAKVMMTDILEAEGKAAAAELGENARFMTHDVRHEDAWTAVVDATIAEFGGIDILVNNAGILQFMGLLDADGDFFRNILDVNLVGPQIGMRSVVPHMAAKGGGSIVNMSSADGLEGANAVGCYGASKWGLRGLTKVAALEWGPKGIRVNSVHPGGINTPMANPQGIPTEMMDEAFKAYPLQRMGHSSEVAGVVIFLASDESSYCTGSEIAVDGGMTAGHYYMGLPGSPGN